MADTVISSFLNKLGYMLLAEVDWLLEVEDQLRSLYGMLTRLTSFIMEVERKQNEDFMEHRKNVVKKFVMDVITLVHEAEVVIDLYLNTIREGNYVGTFMDEAHKFRSQIKGMMELLKDSHAWFNRFIESNTSGTCSSSKRQQPLIKYGNEDAVVVLEDEVKRMIDLLIKDEDGDGRRDVIPVVGRGGLGKTTLVQKVYNDKTIVEHFPCRSWIYVSSNYKMKELLQDILKQIIKPTTAAATADNNDNDEERKEMTLKDLAIQIYKHLKDPTIRYLFVFDDVCKTQFWADINMVFPNNKCGSRIIFTTRHDEVGFHVGPSKPPFYLRRFSKEESWALFSKRVIRPVNSPSHFELEPSHPWEELVDACGGLPLTIIALATEYHHRLPLVRKNEKDEECSLDKILPLEICELIYNALPHHLKMCLVCWDVLKESYPFTEYKGLIVAEGLVKPPSPSPSSSVIQSRGQASLSSSSSSSAVVELEDIAEEYLNELINMNLVKVQNRCFDGRIKTITISQEYSSLSDLCGSEASKMNLKVRYLFNSSETTMPDLERICPHFVLLSVMDLRNIDFHGYPYRFNLIHLRYLRVHFKSKSNYPSDFPNSLSNLWNLQFIKISFSKFPVDHIPLQFWKMRQLRHISWPGVLLDPSLEKEMNSDQSIILNNLQTLEGLSIKFSVEDTLSTMPNLVTLLLYNMTGVVDQQPRRFPLLKRLRKLKLVGDFGAYARCELEIYFPNITHLTLVGTYIPQGYLMPSLQKLQNLLVLKMGNGSTSEEEHLDFGSNLDGFRQLRFLKLKSWIDLEKWSLSAGVMPRLQKVAILGCQCLRGLPSAALIAIPTLQELVLHRPINEGVLTDARLLEERIGKDRLKLCISS